MRVGVKIVVAASASVVVTLAGCSAGEQAPEAGGGYPTTVQNCGHGVQVDRKPERVVALGPSEVTTLYSAGGASKIVGRDDAGLKSAAYPADIRNSVASAPQLGTGGDLTRENVIAMQPDLVVGSVTETINADTLGAVGLPLVSLRGNCGSDHAPGASDGTADFEDVMSDVETLGRLLGTSDQATASVADMRRRIAAAKPPAAEQGKTAAAVIVFENGLEVYGRQSMAHTQFQALGMRDVFADTNSRVFDASIEEVLSRNPDTVMILSYGETDQEAREKFLRIPGAANLTAVRNNAVFVQPYEYSSQGTLSVTGLENMARNLGRA